MKKHAFLLSLMGFGFMIYLVGFLVYLSPRIHIMDMDIDLTGFLVLLIPVVYLCITYPYLKVLDNGHQQ